MKFYAVLVVTLFFYINLYSQCYIAVDESGFEYNVSVDIQILDILYTQSGSTCNANIEIGYDIDIDVVNAPSWWNENLYVLQGNLNCIGGSGSSFFDLPNDGGSGSVISETFSFNNSDCGDVIIDCPIEISIQGPSLSIPSMECGSLENAVAPVVLNNFNHKSSEYTTDFFWSTSSEIDFSHFNLEVSKDGRNWESISYIEGKSETGASYKVTIPNEQTNYYSRLVMIDLDGSTDISRILFIENNPVSDEIIISPNPSDGLITLTNSEGTYSAEIFDNYGRMVTNIRTNKTIELYDLPAGQYILKLISESNEVTFKKFILL